MAERIVSPGVFTREKDLSFLPQGISDIGAAIVGPTKKGPSFVPTAVTSFEEFKSIFGSYDVNYYTPYAVQEYLRSAGTVTIVRVGYLGGYKVAGVNILVSGSSATLGEDGKLVVATIMPTVENNEGGSGLSGSLGGTANFGSFNLSIIGDSTNTITGLTLIEKGSAGGGLDAADSSYFGKSVPSDAQARLIGSTAAAGYIYKSFRTSISASYAAGDNFISSSSTLSLEIVSQSFSEGTETVDTSDGNYILTNTGNKDASAARTPFIQSQSPATNLFRIYTRADGNDTNGHYVVIRDVKRPQNSNSSPDYAQFSLFLYEVGNPSSVESYSGLNMDPESSNYIVKVIGDQFSTVSDDGEVTTYGDYPNLSRLIRVGDYKEDVFRGNKNLQPMGFAAINNPITANSATHVPSASMNLRQTYDGGFNDDSTYVVDLPYGFRIDAGFSETELATNKEYLSPIPNPVETGNNVAFNLENEFGYGKISSAEFTKYTNFAISSQTLTISSSLQQLKFAVPFQFGFDGINPAAAKKTGTSISSTNTSGFDCSTSTASGSVAYKKAINAVSNPDEVDINMLVTPGIIHKHHSVVSNHAIDKVESRADAFYIMDGNDIDDNVATAVDNVVTLDTNYVATYYPWVKMDNPAGNGQIFVPPSVVIAGVISFTDSVAHEWFAPAGLNRGGLDNVRMTKKKLTHTDRDTLYEGRVNPIASFPGQGVVVFGQKTLQAKPSALDRINVRRLLIRLKKFIASSSRFLLFEQNDSSTRARFLNIVNPFLESVQANSGLSAFKVVMDDSNNTPDVIDRNQLVGQIFIQPTRTAEFIILDFSVLPTGAAFPE